MVLHLRSGGKRIVAGRDIGSRPHGIHFIDGPDGSWHTLLWHPRLEASRAFSGSSKSNLEASSLYSSGTLRIHELTAEERAVYATLKPERLPEHVAIIMDGNGRWAGHRLLKRFQGHQQE